VTTGELITRWTVRLALACYFIAIGMHLTSHLRSNTARIIYSLGVVFFFAHVIAAFEVFHHWSHRDAYLETARQTREFTGYDTGIGLWLNYLFTLTWLFDAAFWWRVRSPSITHTRLRVALHVFMLFIIFNATAVFEAGIIRWLGAAGCAIIIGLALRRRVASAS
jgi:hypothetical protein